MSSNLRSQFAATSTKELKAVVEDEDAKVASGKWSENLEFEDGMNKFRLFPKHPGETAFTQMQCRHWLSKDEDGEDKRFTVPNSKIHAGTEKDIIEEYAALVRRTLSATDAEDAVKIKALSAYPGGIGAQTSWIAYANKISKEKKQFGLLELKRTVRDALNSLSIIEDASEAIEVDPFTDPDTGKPFLVTYNSKAKKSTGYYTGIQLSKSAMPLTDEELEAFSKITPLSQLPQVNYTITDFENALEGLQFFDDSHDINLFNTEEFQAIIEELKLQYDEGERKVDGGDEKKAKTAVTKAPVKSAPVKTAAKRLVPVAAELDEELEEPIEEEVEEVVEDTTDQFDAMDRTELKQFIVKNGLKDSIKVFQTDTDDAIRDKIRAAWGTEELPFEVDEVVEVKEKVQQKTTPGKAPTLQEIKDKLAQNKKK